MTLDLAVSCIFGCDCARNITFVSRSQQESVLYADISPTGDTSDGRNLTAIIDGKRIRQFNMGRNQFGQIDQVTVLPQKCANRNVAVSGCAHKEKRHASTKVYR